MPALKDQSARPGQKMRTSPGGRHCAQRGAASRALSCDIREVDTTDVLIRDVPDDVIAALDAHAGRLGLSRSEYVRRRLARTRPGFALP